MNYIIVTNTYKRSSLLVNRSLKASLKQKIKPAKVILIDQNEIPVNIDNEISSSPLFERHCVKIKSVSAARNTLVIPEGTDWIFFCDDDGYPCENYSEILQNLIDGNKDLQILAGSIVRDDNHQYYTLRHKKGGSLRYFRNTKNLMGSNFVVKASVFNELGRFDEKFGAGSFFGSSEETDFCWKAFFSNSRMEYFPELIVYHLPPFNESLKKGFKKSFHYGTGKGALVWKWLRKGKVIVLYEFIEMIIVPFIQSLKGLVTFNPSLILTNLAGLIGRIYGIFKGMIYLK